MPIVDVQLVCNPGSPPGGSFARALADSLGKVFSSPPGRTWVRVHAISSDVYAENNVVVSGSELPVFVTVLHAHLPTSEALAEEVRSVTQAVAAMTGRLEERVHVQYAPAGTGRQAFGGKLVL